MITKTINLYEFDELGEVAKKKAISVFADRAVDDAYLFLKDDLNYRLTELLEENKIVGDVKSILYSLSYCQGDGVMFEGHFDWTASDGKVYDVQIVHMGRYCHKNSKMIEIFDSEGSQLWGSVCGEFDKIYVSICKELERYGYDVIDTARGEENVIEIIKSGENWFDVNGELVDNN